MEKIVVVHLRFGGKEYANVNTASIVYVCVDGEGFNK